MMRHSLAPGIMALVLAIVVSYYPGYVAGAACVLSFFLGVWYANSRRKYERF